MKSVDGEATHTVTDWSGIRVVPGSVDLATDDPLSPVVVSWVAHKHHDSVILVLGSVYQSPPPVFHSRVADVGTGHRWKGQRSKQVSGSISWSLVSFQFKKKEIARVTQMSSAKEKEYSRTHLDGVSAGLHLPDS